MGTAAGMPEMLHANSGTDTDDESRVKSLVADYKRGNKDAFAEILALYRNQVVSLAYKMTRDYDEAADISQSVFVKMSRNIWRYDPRKKFYTWLYRITVNASIDHIRKYRRHHHESLDNFHDLKEKSHLSPEFTYRRQQLKGHIEQAANSLNQKQRSAFLLRDVQGCRVDDVANIMNMPEATVRWYLHRARARIRKELNRRCPHLLVLMGVK